MLFRPHKIYWEILFASGEYRSQMFPASDSVFLQENIRLTDGGETEIETGAETR